MSFGDQESGGERRAAPREGEEVDTRRDVARLKQTIYGLPEEEGSGLVRGVRELKEEVNKTNGRLTGAAVSFGLLALGVVVEGLLK